MDTTHTIWHKQTRADLDKMRLTIVCNNICMRYIVTIPSQRPEYVNFFKPFHFLAGDQLVVPIGASHISSWLLEIQSRKWEERTKNKRTIWAWVNSKCKKRSMYHCIPLCICKLTLTWISSENSTTHEECWLILTGLPSLWLDPISWQLVSRLAGVDWPLASPFANCLPLGSFVQPLLVFPYLLTVASRFLVQTLCVVSRQNRRRDRLLGWPPT